MHSIAGREDVRRRKEYRVPISARDSPELFRIGLGQQENPHLATVLAGDLQDSFLAWLRVLDQDDVIGSSYRPAAAVHGSNTIDIKGKLRAQARNGKEEVSRLGTVIEAR